MKWIKLMVLNWKLRRALRKEDSLLLIKSEFENIENNVIVKKAWGKVWRKAVGNKKKIVAQIKEIKNEPPNSVILDVHSSRHASRTKGL